eukprot:COSAG01_NODE_1624_length_9704_cov_186.948777_6_plen_188_part_00
MHQCRQFWRLSPRLSVSSSSVGFCTILAMAVNVRAVATPALPEWRRAQIAGGAGACVPSGVPSCAHRHTAGRGGADRAHLLFCRLATGCAQRFCGRPRAEALSTDVLILAEAYRIYRVHAQPRAFAKQLNKHTKRLAGLWRGACPSTITPHVDDTGMFVPGGLRNTQRGVGLRQLSCVKTRTTNTHC